MKVVALEDFQTAELAFWSTRSGGAARRPSPLAAGGNAI